MSIFDRTGETAQLEPLELRLDRFAGRRDLALNVLRKVHEPAAGPHVLFVHGMGGNGKTLLLKYLQARCCVRFDEGDWAAVKRDFSMASFDQLREAGRGTAIPSALIDFGARPVGQQRPLEPLPALFMLKRQLAKWGITTPRFDFAAVTYLQKSGLSFKAALPELFPAAEAELAKSIADFVSGIPVVSAGKALLDLVDSRTDHAVGRWKLARGLERNHVHDILSASADPVLADRLPFYFALDLNEALAENTVSRIALLCDTHEAFWGEDAFPTANAASLAALARDKWLRVLIGHLHLERGFVIVVAGRKPPRWSVAEEAAIPTSFVDLQHLGGLSRADASWFLVQQGIVDPEVQHAVISYASETPDDVHPYMLGLYSDVARVAPEELAVSSTTAGLNLGLRRQRLVGRLMSSVSEETHRRVVAVAAARSFDQKVYTRLGERRSFSHTLDDYRRLVTFSFVQVVGEPQDGQDPAFAVHKLLRRELGQMFAAETREAHAELADYYLARNDAASMAEAAFHQAHVEPERGARTWLDGVDRLLAIGRFSQAQAFVGVVPELVSAIRRSDLETDIYSRVGRIYVGTGAIAEAEAIYDQLAAGAVDAVLLRADLDFCRCDFDAAEATARAGLADAAGLDADRLAVRLAEILLYRGDFAAADDLLGPRGESHGLLGIAREVLRGEVAFFAGRVDEAEETFSACVHALEARAVEERDDSTLGWALAGVGLVHLARREWAEATAVYERSLRLRAGIGHGRGVVNALLGLARSAAGRGAHDDALTLLGRAARLALDQGDAVTIAKIRHTEALSQLANGNTAVARDLLRAAVQTAQSDCVPFDEAHSLLDLSRVELALGNAEAAMTARANARDVLSGRGFGFLEQAYLGELEDSTSRILSGMTAFAIADAVGAPWEGCVPAEIQFGREDHVRRRDDWPLGATSDDTDQLLVAAGALVAAGEDATRLPALVLEGLSARLPFMRGVGPTTPAAVRRFEATGVVVASAGATNGAVVRGLAVGWRFQPSDDLRRREAVDALARATHGHAEALVGARIVAVLASWAVEGAAAQTLIAKAGEELQSSLLDHPLTEAQTGRLRAALDGTWTAPANGIGMAALETVAAVIAVIRQAKDATEATVQAVRLGGDTDSVASLAAALLACRSPDGAANSPWKDEVRLLEPLDDLAADVARLREADAA